MVTKIIEQPPLKNIEILASPLVQHVAPTELPTFAEDVGYKLIYNPETGETEQFPLTLLDILYPQEEQEGVQIVVTQNHLHGLWITRLRVILETYLGDSWLIMNDVLIRWDNAPGKSPDIAVFVNIPSLSPDKNSYRVGLDGPSPIFVVEITSGSTRAEDIHAKRLHYAAVGVKEYLIVDRLTSPWRLWGYRLQDSPFYHEIKPDTAAGLTFETIGVRFTIVGQDNIELYDAQTGQRLLKPAEEAQARIKAENRAKAEAEARTKAETHAKAEAEARTKAETHAKAEAEARANAETRAETAELRIAELETRLYKLGNQSPEGSPDE